MHVPVGPSSGVRSCTEAWPRSGRRSIRIGVCMSHSRRGGFDVLSEAWGCQLAVAACAYVFRGRRKPKATAFALANDVPAVDLGGCSWFRQGEDSPPPTEMVAAVRQALASHGLFSARGHGVPLRVVQRVRSESMAFFDQPLEMKQCCAVHNMERNRGYEIYPHHQRFLEQWQGASVPRDAHAEPSAVQGVICERFCCGPPSICEVKSDKLEAKSTGLDAWKLDDFYRSEYGEVFFPENVWPSDCDALKRAMLEAYDAFESFSEAVLLLLAAASGVQPSSLRSLLFDSQRRVRHSSMLQVCNYPSLLPRRLRPPELSVYQLRAKAHQDFGAFTVLARCPGSDSGRAKCGQSGALEVRLPTGAWACVPAREDALTVMPGTLIEYLTAGRCRGVMHRVSNPRPGLAADSRRLSVTFTAASRIPPCLPLETCGGWVGRSGSAFWEQCLVAMRCSSSADIARSFGSAYSCKATRRGDSASREMAGPVPPWTSRRPDDHARYCGVNALVAELGQPPSTDNQFLPLPIAFAR
ncbi:vldW [Symbiodinium natans]|uniref:VldW protein n=1 Tax=Symbiodinium natans TaxID=878477 RepID=A0A812TK74_9DINO|nr:vldW [Symbiodinium natans]